MHPQEMLKLIIFDCDGVMFDSKEANRRYYNDLLTHFGYPEMTEAEASFVHMHNVVESVRHIFRHYPNQNMDEVHRHRSESDYTHYLQYMIIEPDLIAFLQYASKRFHLAISTNRTTTMPTLLHRYGLTDYFQLVVTAGDVKNPKPAPDALHKILTYFGCTPAESIFIGDSIIDRDHAGSMNIPLIAFKNSDLEAQYHIRSFMEICDLPPFQTT